MKLSGIAAIAQERHEQLTKHNRHIIADARWNDQRQLIEAASKLLSGHGSATPPQGWSQEIWDKMRLKPIRERVIIAGALCAAEIDRQNYMNL